MSEASGSLDLATVANPFRILGALFYRAPDAAGMAELRHYLATDDLAEKWPWGSPAQLSAIVRDFAAAPDEAGLAREYQRLFIGPDALPAPPWGSVYLDRECCLFGDSTLRLMDFCAEQGFESTSEQREPPDHFGMLCSLVALLAESRGDKALLCDFLAEHLLPWRKPFLERFEQATQDCPFYRAAARLATLSLDALQAQWQIEAHPYQIYFGAAAEEEVTETPVCSS